MDYGQDSNHVISFRGKSPHKENGGEPALRLGEGRGTRICGGFCSLKAGPPAPPTLRFPERTRVALRSDLAHGNHQNSNFLFRLR